MTTDVVVTTNDVTTVVVVEVPTTVATLVETINVITEGAQGPQGPAGVQGAAGPQGPQGPAGSTDLGGSPVSISGLAAGDTLLYSGSAWQNQPKETISDGGNF